jgi:protoheme IX farnesyltransferase
VTPTNAVAATIARDRRQVLSDLAALTKPRVVVMVLVTTAVGYDVGLAGPPDYVRLLHTLIGTMLAAGGTLALNQYVERDVDALMARTRARPLPDGRLAPVEALVFATAITVLGLAYLAVSVNALTAGIVGLTAALYLGAYTPLKRVTPLCTLVGAVPGALPPVAGWAAARDDLGSGAWVLFAILFLWQVPHTLAIGRLYRDDYARGGIRILPVVDGSGSATERHALAGSLALLAVSVLPTALGIAGPVYLSGAVLLGAALVVLGVMQARMPSAVTARRVLFGTLLYLPLVLGLLAVDVRRDGPDGRGDAPVRRADAPGMAADTPALGSAPAQPWRSSTTVR